MTPGRDRLKAVTVGTSTCAILYGCALQTEAKLLVGDQLDAKFFYIIRLFQSSTCFEQTRAHHQEVNCINTASG